LFVFIFRKLVLSVYAIHLLVFRKKYLKYDINIGGPMKGQGSRGPKIFFENFLLLYENCFIFYFFNYV